MSLTRISAARFTNRSMGSCLSFNGTTANVALANSFNLNYNGIYSFALWINPSSFGVPIISHEKVAAGYDGFTLQLNANGSLEFDYVTTLNSNDLLTNSVSKPIIPRVWQHIVCTYNNKTVKYYYNTVLLTTNVARNGLTSSYNTGLSIASKIGGRDNATTGMYQGLMDEVMYWSGKEISQTEINDLYYRRLIPSGVTSYWLFNEGSGGSATDGTGGGNTGTITAATYTINAPLNTRSASGSRIKYPISLKFGTADTDVVAVAETASLPLTTQTNFTISVWVYTRQLGGGGYIFCEGNSSTIQPVFAFGNLINSRKMIFFSRADSGGSTVNGTVDIFMDNIWQNITLTCASNNVKIYCNGVNTGQTFSRWDNTTTLNRTSWGALRRVSVASSYKGNLYDGLMYARVLSDSEILGIYNGTIPASTNLVARHKMNEGLGITATDSSGNNNTGTITGATYTNVDYPNRTAV